MKNIKLLFLFIILCGAFIYGGCSFEDKKSADESVEERINLLKTFQTVEIPVVSTEKK